MRLWALPQSLASASAIWQKMLLLGAYPLEEARSNARSACSQAIDLVTLVEKTSGTMSLYEYMAMPEMTRGILLRYRKRARFLRRAHNATLFAQVALCIGIVAMDGTVSIAMGIAAGVVGLVGIFINKRAKKASELSSLAEKVAQDGPEARRVIFIMDMMESLTDD